MMRLRGVFGSVRRLKVGLLSLSSIFVFTLAQAEEEVSPREETVVTSDHLEMVSTETTNFFYFTDNVEIRGNNLYASSDKMEVVASRAGGSDEGSIGQFGGVQKIILTGNVVIRQAGREATSGKALILPLEEEVILTENPTVKDGEGTITGEEMILKKSERRAIVKGGENQRPTVILPGFDDLSYDDKDEENAEANN